MEQAIKYWECSQNPDHIFDWDDWRIKVDYWTYVAHCPYDHRTLTEREAKVSGA
jgi:glutathionyl-hydroquinone reductase